MEEGDGTVVEGVIPRIVSAPNPLEMFSPFAPPSYGSSRRFVTYTDDRLILHGPTQNKTWFQPDGLRLLTLRPFP